MQNPFVSFVDQFVQAADHARNLAVSGRAEPLDSELRALLFSPHPDDECITGLLPLRLMREANVQIINVPVTFGDNPSRQKGRSEELMRACEYLGFQCLEKTPRRPAGVFQALEKEDVVDLLRGTEPGIIFMPHAKDLHPHHIDAHNLVMDALAALPESFSCLVAETEFWGAMERPNLMIEGSVAQVADLVAATSLHTGEVARNPYHLSLPAWMIDNVRRGGELIFGLGAEVPAFSFATLYHLSRWESGQKRFLIQEGLALSCLESVAELFKL